MSEFDSKLAQCPYYVENYNTRQARNNQIRCEGVDPTNKICLVFTSKPERHKYMVKYCFEVKMCKQCRIHRLLDEKYAEEEEDE